MQEVKKEEKVYIEAKRDEEGNYFFEISSSLLSAYTNEEIDAMVKELDGKKLIECTIEKDAYGRLLALLLPVVKK